MTRQERGPRIEPVLVEDALRGHGVAEVLECRPVLLARASGGGVELWLDLLLRFPGGPDVPTMLLLEVIDPYVLAGELAGVADALVAQTLRDRGADAQQVHEATRSMRLRERRRRQEVSELVLRSNATGCDADGCQRSVSFVVEGMKLCKRHAEELGVRPHGKIGGPEPTECAECGHLHHLGGGEYGPCPVEGCECEGQA